MELVVKAMDFLVKIIFLAAKIGELMSVLIVLVGKMVVRIFLGVDFAVYVFFGFGGVEFVLFDCVVDKVNLLGNMITPLCYLRNN